MTPSPQVRQGGEARRYSAADGLGAVRLAVEAAADARALRRVLRAIFERTPEPTLGDTASVALLIDAVRAANAEFRLTDHEPRGRLATQRRGKRVS
jgi:hypothetical protein